MELNDIIKKLFNNVLLPWDRAPGGKSFFLSVLHNKALISDLGYSEPNKA